MAINRSRKTFSSQHTTHTDLVSWPPPLHHLEECYDLTRLESCPTRLRSKPGLICVSLFLVQSFAKSKQPYLKNKIIQPIIEQSFLELESVSLNVISWRKINIYKDSNILIRFHLKFRSTREKNGIKGRKKEKNSCTGKNGTYLKLMLRSSERTLVSSPA